MVRVWCVSAPFAYFAFGYWSRSIFQDHVGMYNFIYSLSVVITTSVVLMTFFIVAAYMYGNVSKDLQTIFWVGWLASAVFFISIKWIVLTCMLIIYLFSHLCVLQFFDENEKERRRINEINDSNNNGGKNNSRFLKKNVFFGGNK